MLHGIAFEMMIVFILAAVGMSDPPCFGLKLGIQRIDPGVH
jgi:hypothetical protein